MALMELPDPPDITTRGNRETCVGDPYRVRRWQHLPQMFVRIRQQEKRDISEAKGVAWR